MKELDLVKEAEEIIRVMTEAFKLPCNKNEVFCWGGLEGVCINYETAKELGWLD